MLVACLAIAAGASGEHAVAARAAHRSCTRLVARRRVAQLVYFGGAVSSVQTRASRIDRGARKRVGYLLRRVAKGSFCELQWADPAQEPRAAAAAAWQVGWGVSGRQFRRIRLDELVDPGETARNARQRTLRLGHGSTAFAEIWSDGRYPSQDVVYALSRHHNVFVVYIYTPLSNTITLVKRLLKRNAF